MKDAFRHSRELLDFLNLPYNDSVKENGFPTLVTKIFAGKMTNQYDDPLLKQVLPDILEEKRVLTLDIGLLVSTHHISKIMLTKVLHG